MRSGARARCETIEGIRLIKAEIPGVKTSLGVSNVSFGVGVPARSALNSVFLHHCVEAGLDLAMVNPNHITPYGEIPGEERELADDLVFNRREDALERFIAHFEAKGPAQEAMAANPTEGMEPEEALHFHILRRKKEGVEDWIDASVEKIGAVPTLNDVLLPAMKEVGDKFGAGELILPFVLQSAEVMKRAVARLERYLDRIEGYTKGTVVLATVFGDVHDIGKSLVNTILTNNGYTVVDLGKQVPISTILDAAVEHEATAIGLSALLVSTSKQMPAAVQELHARGLPFPVLVGGAAINRNFGLRILYPNGKDSQDLYEPGVFYCKDAFEGLAKMDQLVDADARERLLADTQAAAKRLRETPERVDEGAPPVTDASVRAPVSTDNPVPEPPFWGVREIDIEMDEVYHHLDTHVLFKLHWGGRGVKGEAWSKLVSEDFQPRLERMWREQDYLRPRALQGYFPCNSDGNELIVWDPQAPGEVELERLVFPRQPRHDRICLADFYRPVASGEVDVVALQAVTAGDQVTELMAKLEADGEFAEQLFTHGLGVQTAEGMAEWLHSRARSRARHRPHSGAPVLVGLSRLPGAVRAREGLPAARRAEHRPAPVGRLRRRARAVDARHRRPPSPGGLLRDEVGLPAQVRPPGRRRADRRQRARSHAADAAARRRPRAARRARPRGRRRRAGGRAGAGRLDRWASCSGSDARPSPQAQCSHEASSHRRASSALCLMAAPAASAASQHPGLFGVVMTPDLAASPASILGPQMALMQRSGVQSLRTGIDWETTEPARGVFDWRQDDLVVGRLPSTIWRSCRSSSPPPAGPRATRPRRGSTTRPGQTGSTRPS